MLIYTVCGAGIGTSVILKSNVDRVLLDLGIEADVQAVSVAKVESEEIPAQLVLVTPEVLSHITTVRSEVVVIENIHDLQVLREKLESALG
ncbi:MAG: PTS sugar transporter subunit IIB [Aquiluna sp.]|jgi:PTS system ascorbate-specific IIB component